MAAAFIRLLCVMLAQVDEATLERAPASVQVMLTV
jgi:hypothetical protein